MATHSSPRTDSITVQLLDASSGRVIQVWQIAAREAISIGRSEERDVTIADPYVSRHHAELRFQNGQWSLVALGRNGVLLNGREVKDSPLSDGTVFRLGTSGPLLKFFGSPLSAQDTLTLAGAEVPPELLLDINAQKRDEEVRGIAESEYFRQLQDRARQLRKQRPDDK